jgi:hypothetical protein
LLSRPRSAGSDASRAGRAAPNGVEGRPARSGARSGPFRRRDGGAPPAKEKFPCNMLSISCRRLRRNPPPRN